MKLGLLVVELFEVNVLAIFPWERNAMVRSTKILSTESNKNSTTIMLARSTVMGMNVMTFGQNYFTDQNLQITSAYLQLPWQRVQMSYYIENGDKSYGNTTGWCQDLRHACDN